MTIITGLVIDKDDYQEIEKLIYKSYKKHLSNEWKLFDSPFTIKLSFKKCDVELAPFLLVKREAD